MGPGFESEPEVTTRVEGCLKKINTVLGYTLLGLTGALLGEVFLNAPWTGAGIGLFILAARDLVEGE